MGVSALRPDLDAALAEWAARVRANREQVDRVREVADGDFYAPVAQSFRPDPADEDDPVLRAVGSLVRSDDVVLDIGAGGGRFALPLARVAKRVIALDPSPAMIAVLREAVAGAALGNVEILEARWPMREPGPTADVSLVANLGHDVEDIGAFLDAAERATRRLCVIAMLELPPPHAIDALWETVHGETRATLPALPELVALQLARGRLCEVRLIERRPAEFDPEAFLARARRLLWVKEGTEKDRRLREIARQGPPAAAPRYGIVSWRPPGARS